MVTCDACVRSTRAQLKRCTRRSRSSLPAIACAPATAAEQQVDRSEPFEDKDCLSGGC